MKTYLITDNSVEKIEFVAGNCMWSLVHHPKDSSWDNPPKTTIMNKRELEALFWAEIEEGIIKWLDKRKLLELYQAIQEEILKPKVIPILTFGKDGLPISVETVSASGLRKGGMR